MPHLRRHTIGSGQFSVSPAGRSCLEAYLGSCVGVGIVDRHANVGGLLHVLLPDATAADGATGVPVSATTAVPLFLEELRHAGCSPASMEATIAGGALLGEVSSLDLDLDIGGRTLEIVNERLEAAGIRVVASETGGYFGARLSVNLHTMSCAIEPMAPALGSSHERPTPLSAEELDRATSRVRPIPQVALKVIRMIQAEDFSLRDVADEVGRDQVLTASVIRACNSGYRGGRGEIRSVEQAVILLGGRRVGTLIVSAMMGSFFGRYPRGYSMSRGGLYHHAVATATVAERLAALTDAVPFDLAYTAGLLHDIGKVALDQYVAAARPLFYREVLVEGRALLDVERGLLGVTHEEAGARLATLWAFPEALREAVAHHSSPEQAEGDQRLAYLVHLADLLVSRFASGHELDRLARTDLPAVCHQLGIAPDGLPSLIAEIKWDAMPVPSDEA